MTLEEERRREISMTDDEILEAAERIKAERERREEAQEKILELREWMNDSTDCAYSYLSTNNEKRYFALSAEDFRDIANFLIDRYDA